MIIEILGLSSHLAANDDRPITSKLACEKLHPLPAVALLALASRFWCLECLGMFPENYIWRPFDRDAFISEKQGEHFYGERYNKHAAVHDRDGWK
jgi:hypothetical protein